MSLYDASVPSLISALRSFDQILDKARAWGAEQGMAESDWVDARLAPDMFDLKRQVQVFCDMALKGCERLAGKEPKAIPDTETTAEALKARIGRTITGLEALDRASFEGAETRTVVIPTPNGKISFPGQVYLYEFVIPNFYFHASMVYAILRNRGVPLSKQDYLGGIKQYFEAVQ